MKTTKETFLYIYSILSLYKQRTHEQELFFENMYLVSSKRVDFCKIQQYIAINNCT